ncbi:hypothetical protein B0H19DRAFT_1233278 [Mycena capillaripes]|nr:hypothetical protein B0H19DRAFT_1233278 [Mycena capillaripes]
MMTLFVVVFFRAFLGVFLARLFWTCDLVGLRKNGSQVRGPAYRQDRWSRKCYGFSAREAAQGVDSSCTYIILSLCNGPPFKPELLSFSS